MNRSFLLSMPLLLLLLSTAATAQLRVGPKAGVQISRTQFADPDYRSTHKSYLTPGLLAGLQVNYRVNKLYSLQTELNWSQIGRHVKRVDPLRSTIDNRTRYQYLNLPILLRLSGHKAIRGNHLEYYMNVGPNINYWLGGRGTIKSGEIQEHTATESMKYKIVFDSAGGDYLNRMYIANPRRLQMSLDFGGGVIFDLGFGQHITLDLRASFGIGKTYMGDKNGGDFGIYEYSENLEAVNHVFGVSVGYVRDLDLMAMLVKGKTKKR